jgi:hypothetical protein
MMIKGEEFVARNTVACLKKFSSDSGLTLKWEKSAAYWWAPGGMERP